MFARSERLPRSLAEASRCLLVDESVKILRTTGSAAIGRGHSCSVGGREVEG
jgi:hypothetical protein